MLPKMRRRALTVESLEPRLVLSAPGPYPGTPLELPGGGTWRNTTFIGSPIVADLNNDGRDEIISPADGGRLIAYTAGPDGRLVEFQRYETGAEASIKSTPIVVTRPGGSKMVVSGLGRDEFASPTPLEDGRVFAWDAVTGQILPGWPQGTGGGGIFGPLAAGDLDGDGVDEIVVTSLSHLVHAFRQDGSVLWRFQNDDTIESGAVIGDIDRDGKPEVVFGGDTSDNGFFQPGGFINVLNANGSAKFRIPTKEVIWSAPVLADITGDGFLEIVVGTGLTFSLTAPDIPAAIRAEARVAANQLYAYDHQGQVVPGWPYRTTTDPSLNRQITGSPAVADLTGDGQLEVVVVDFAGFVHAVRGNGQPLPGFEGGRPLAPPGAGFGDTYSSPIIADANGDGTADILVSTRQTLYALDRSGNELWSILAPAAPGGPNDTFFNAAAIGQVDGVGGLELVTSTNLTAFPNPPRGLGVYQLQESTLTPPWPMQRKAADGTAIEYSPAFLTRYIRATFRAILGREASDSDLTFFSEIIRSNVWTPKVLADTVALTPEARTVVIRQLYDSYLQRSPTDEEIAAGQQELATGTAEEIARTLLLSPESIGKTDGSIPAVLERFYATILRRQLTQGEIDILEPVVRQGLVPLPEIARLLLRSEEFVLLEIAAPTVIAYRTEFPDAPFDDVSIASILLDRRGGRREEEMRANLISTGGRYERATTIAGLIRSTIADLTLRQPDPTEVIPWIRGFTTGEVTPDSFFASIINSPEARAQYVREQVRDLLGREADAGTVASLSSFVSREELVISLVASQEYFARAGGSNTGFVRAAFRDLYEVDPIPESVLSQQVNVLNQGRQTREGLARSLVFSEPYYQQNVVGLLFRYLPDESKGVLRGSLFAPPGSPPDNPDPALIQSLVAARLAGAGEANTLASILISPTYLGKTSYIRGIFQRVGNRF